MRKKKHEVRQRDDSSANHYESRYNQIQKQKYIEIFSQKNIPSNAIIYDVGGGTGLLLKYMEDLSTTTIVCDISLIRLMGIFFT